MGFIQIEITSWGAQIETGPLYYGQTKDLIFKLKNVNSITDCIKVTTKYKHFGEFKQNICNLVTTVDQLYEIQKLRLQSVEAIYFAYDQMRYGNQNVAENAIKSILEVLSCSQYKDEKYVKDITTDLKEQVSIAISKLENILKNGENIIYLH